MKRKKQLQSLVPWLVTLALFLFWELTCWLFKVPPFVLPRPSLIFTTMYQFRGQIWFHSLQTLFTTIIGFGLAVGGGLLIGLAVGASRIVYTSLYPLLIGFNSIPKVALVPVIVIWFGIGTIPAIITAFSIAFFPIAVNVATGLATIEPEMRDVLRSLGASRYEILTKVGIPRSTPYLFASLKIAITLSFIGSVISETVASNQGIGYLMLSASSRFEVPLVFAGLLVVGAMGIAMYAICVLFEQRMTKWAFRGSELSA
ncbi:MAG: ABC transporter permease [Pseudorhodoplanes sp.]|nr:Riboflavin transport system permease protein RibX [Pseudorhodoplanes sp.]MBW7948477.1 ABC transporter permease [Pseudorhodoplanes sp.]MCL4711144.1 ABC transporter permease [Pseudorhodoplanes sp.]GIK80304.1 MAG: ABC transporter permease [Alphaproteobacteria bacterium]